GILLDPTKVTIDISGCGYTVEDLQKELFERYNIQVEKSTFNTLTLLLTIGTTRSKVSRLYDALMRTARQGRPPRRLVQTPEIPGFTDLRYLPRDAYYCGGELLPVFDERERVNRKLVARICADQIVPYPPGLPVLVSHLMNTYARQNVAFVRGEGVWLWDEDGRKYLDALAGIAVNTLGYGHPKLTRALSARLASGVIHTSNLWRIPDQEAAAERVAEITGLDEV